MPVLKTFIPEPNCLVGIWHITENFEDLLSVSFNDKMLAEQSFLIKNEKKKVEFLASRLLLKHVCEKFMVNNYTLEKNINKKPHLKGFDGFVSISHTEAYCAVIIHSKNEVGVDIEKIQPKLERIFPKFISEKESVFFARNIESMCIAWSSKETIYKKLNVLGLDFIQEIKLQSISNQIIEAKSNDTLHTIHIEKIDGHILAYSFN